MAYGVAAEPIVYICTNEQCPDFEERWHVATERDMYATYVEGDTACPTCRKEGKERD